MERRKAGVLRKRTRRARKARRLVHVFRRSASFLFFPACVARQRYRLPPPAKPESSEARGSLPLRRERSGSGFHERRNKTRARRRAARTGKRVQRHERFTMKDCTDFTVLTAMLKAGLKHKRKLKPVAYAKRLATELTAQRRRYCNAFELWRACRRKSCKRLRACSGEIGRAHV